MSGHPNHLRQADQTEGCRVILRTMAAFVNRKSASHQSLCFCETVGILKPIRDPTRLAKPEGVGISDHAAYAVELREGEEAAEARGWVGSARSER